MSRLIVLDTETTGLEPVEEHRIIEIGCVEVLGRRISGGQWHRYINPQRAIDAGAMRVHGISNESLQDMPLFAQLADEFLDYIAGAKLVIHNAAFDVAFLDSELQRVGARCRHVGDVCEVIDSLTLAQRQYPGQRNNLDALCRRLGVDASARQLHGALLDARLLAEVYLAMTSGQGSLELEATRSRAGEATAATISATRKGLVVRATPMEAAAHEAFLDGLDEACSEGSLWRRGLSVD